MRVIDSSSTFNPLERVILIVGGPRSGTTWLGKIFDSHPKVIYRHEPDSASSTSDFPFMVNKESPNLHLAVANEYLNRLCRERSFRSVSKLPLFRKYFLTGWRKGMRLSLIYTLLGVTKLGFLDTYINRIPIPDFIPKKHSPDIFFAIKSVISLGRVGLYQQAIPSGRIVMIIRHPCGYVASVLRGLQAGKMKWAFPARQFSRLTQAMEFGLSLEDFQNMDRVEKLAWNWTLTNEKALQDLEGCGNVIIVTHDKLSKNPILETRRLFEFCKLNWNEQTERFISQSTSWSGRQKYFGVRRNSVIDSDKWRWELDELVISKILAITNQSKAGKLFN